MTYYPVLPVGNKPDNLGIANVLKSCGVSVDNVEPEILTNIPVVDEWLTDLSNPFLSTLIILSDSKLLKKYY